jgi:hypothetical protein
MSKGSMMSTLLTFVGATVRTYITQPISQAYSRLTHGSAGKNNK